MQAAAREHWSNLIDNEGIPDPLGDFGFHHAWEYVRDTCDLCIASGFQLLPRQGGIDDQDPLWIQDLKLYLRGRARARYENNPDEFREGFTLETVTTTSEPLNLPNWLSSYG